MDPFLLFSLACSFCFCQDEPEKWSARGHEALEAENLSLACQCFSFSLLFCPSKNASLQSRLYAWRAEANYKMDKVAEARKDITRCRKIDPTLAKVCFYS